MPADPRLTQLCDIALAYHGGWMTPSEVRAQVSTPGRPVAYTAVYTALEVLRESKRADFDGIRGYRSRKRSKT